MTKMKWVMDEGRWKLRSTINFTADVIEALHPGIFFNFIGSKKPLSLLFQQPI
jgi:hypothetical protein